MCDGEPLRLSGKVMKMRKLMKLRGPGFAPHPGQPLFIKKIMYVCLYINTFSRYNRIGFTELHR
jgi:hypothetical protein